MLGLAINGVLQLAMEPSFFSLFNRSRYLRDLGYEAEEPKERRVQQRKRKEAERFAVASIAFCLKHSRDFRQHFFKRLALSDFTLGDESGVRVEDKRWGDLILVSSDQARVCVIECKIRADLEPHQNPEKDAFWEVGGYGFEIEEAFRGRHRLYVILGAKGSLKLPNGRGLETIQKHWRDLDHAYPHTNLLAADLYQSLAKLGVEQFKLRNTHAMKLGKNSRYAGHAYGILLGVSTRLDLTEGKLKPDNGYTDKSSWYVGLEIRKSDRATDQTNSHGRLQSRVEPIDLPVGWFGYSQDDAKADPFLSVWFYTGSNSAEIAVAKRLQPVLNSGTKLIRHQSEQGGYNQLEVQVSAAELQTQSRSDQDWFVGILSVVTEA